jgi:alkanesulfonate monooxygenase SsuD/methylene tetrahydromethanopterin reductase-like flavin-dependent oxidoreductase (luciferase family)
MPETTLRIGLQLPEVEYVASWSQYMAMARLAGDAGFDSLWMGDHLIYRSNDQPATGPWECLTMLTALATVTTKVELGPLVLSTSFRNPALTAKIAETIDEISGGRFVLGLGAGWNQAEYAAFGFAFDNRFARFSEAFDIIHSLIRTGKVDHNGTYYQARECEVIPRGPRTGTMPILIGSTGERMLRHTLDRVDQWNIWYADFGNTPAGLAPHLERVDRISRELGRDPDTLVRSAAVLVTAPGGSTRSTGAHHERFVPGITGSPAEVGQQLAAFATMGIHHIQVVLDPITPQAIEWLAPALDHARAHAAEPKM